MLTAWRSLFSLFWLFRQAPQLVEGVSKDRYQLAALMCRSTVFVVVVRLADLKHTWEAEGAAACCAVGTAAAWACLCEGARLSSQIHVQAGFQTARQFAVPQAIQEHQASLHKVEFGIACHRDCLSHVPTGAPRHTVCGAQTDCSEAEPLRDSGVPRNVMAAD